MRLTVPATKGAFRSAIEIRMRSDIKLVVSDGYQHLHQPRLGNGAAPVKSTTSRGLGHQSNQDRCDSDPVGYLKHTGISMSA